MRSLLIRFARLASYPYLTTLVLNAGGGAFTGLSWPRAIAQFLCDPKGALTSPNFIKSEKGRMSADGERGGVWGVNVLSAYILVSPEGEKKYRQYACIR
jgi:hypothetical protein